MFCFIIVTYWLIYILTTMSADENYMILHQWLLLIFCWSFCRRTLNSLPFDLGQVNLFSFSTRLHFFHDSIGLKTTKTRYLDFFLCGKFLSKALGLINTNVHIIIKCFLHTLPDGWHQIAGWASASSPTRRSSSTSCRSRALRVTSSKLQVVSVL